MEGYGKRVLVIDDAYSVRYFTCLALSDAGYNVFSAEDGSEGLQQMKKRRYSIVLVDYNMPRVNGGQFIDIARVQWPDTPIILMSGDFSISGQVGGVEGTYACIAKPFDLPKLLDLIADACQETYTSLPARPLGSSRNVPNSPYLFSPETSTVADPFVARLTTSGMTVDSTRDT
jgi:DNA-binding NtrC family response regulator